MYLNIYLHLFFLSHDYIKNHHQDETERKADGGEVGVCTVRGLGDVALHKEHERCPEYCAQQRDEKTY